MFAPMFHRVVASLILALTLAATGCGRRPAQEGALEMPPPVAEGFIPPPPPAFASLGFPTAQTRLTDTNLVGVFQPTASGNPESGLFGSVRTGTVGTRLMPKFHEGLDIAALQRDARGRPLDTVHAVADGTVSLVHRKAGNSDYGIYVVLTHDDPAGPVYTLYAHLASAAPGLTEGQMVSAGTQLGVMGNTALDPIPMSRAHLHFEIGFVQNSRFLSWPGRGNKHSPGGLYNGQNLAGLDPVTIYRAALTTTNFTLLDHLASHPVAFELHATPKRQLDFFDRHPHMWQGEPYSAHGMVLSVTEGGAVIRGRNASDEERAAIGRKPYRVLRVDTTVLGRNGRRLIVQRNGAWDLGERGHLWLQLLMHR